MKTELTYSDITEHLCQHCAHCCLNTFIPVAIDERTFEYLREIGIDIEWDGESDTGIINGGACQHLIRKGDTYKCGIYGTRPQLCKDYNCVAWAKVAGAESEIVKYALAKYNELNAAE